MKISNEQNVVYNIIVTLIFFLGILILLKIGFLQWILWCSILYFFVIKDSKFLNLISPLPINQVPELYFIMWLMAIVMPILFAITYLSARLSGYSNSDDFNN